MPLTMGYSFGDVVLVPFPFTDQSGSKKRPAVIVSSADYQAQRRDLVIMAITSQIRPRPAFAEFTVAAWKKAGLIAPSTVKPVLTTIEKRPGRASVTSRSGSPTSRFRCRPGMSDPRC